MPNLRVACWLPPWAERTAAGPLSGPPHLKLKGRFRGLCFAFSVSVCVLCIQMLGLAARAGFMAVLQASLSIRYAR